MEDYFLRALLYFIIFLILSVGTIIYGSHPKTEIVKSGRLALPEFAHVKPKVELAARSFFIILGMVLFSLVLFPLGRDISYLSKGGLPLTRSGKITYVSAPYGNWFLKQSVMLDGEKDAAEKSYMMMFSSMNLRMDDSFELGVLPNSRMIVSAKLLQRGE